MKGLKIKIQALLLCGVLITGLFSSCASDENIDNGNKVNAGDKVLTLTLNTPKATTTSGAKTRADGTNITGNSTEDKINRLTIGVFSSDGTTVRTIQELKEGTGVGSFTTPTGTPNTTTATLVTNSLVVGDKVLVAVNAPTGTFKGLTNASDFENQAIAIDVALATPFTGFVSPPEVEATDNIPMYGSDYIKQPVPAKTSYTADVKVCHQLAKITLSTLAVAFDPNGPYKKAIFTPTNFFLINVPGDLKFNSAAWSGSAATYQGYDNTNTNTYKKYLGTGSLTLSPLQVDASDATKKSSITPNNILYTMPNSDASTNTKLVIAGKFDSDGDGTSDTTDPVYYPVNINWKYDKTKTPAECPAEDGTDIKKVYPNRNYNCTVTIKTKGAKSPTDKIDPEDVSVTVTVTDFAPINQDTTFE